jgi:hypothetical protein
MIVLDHFTLFEPADGVPDGDYFRMEPPDRVFRTWDGMEDELPLPYSVGHTGGNRTWGYPGGGPNLTAGTLIVEAGADILGDRRLQDLEIQLVVELIQHAPEGEPWCVSLMELRNWLKLG